MMHTFLPTWQHVKPLGRTMQTADSLVLAFSATGAEFAFTGCCCEVTLAGDNHAGDADRADGYARVAIDLDGQRVVDTMLDTAEKTCTVLKADTAAPHVVRIVKLSETAMSICAITAIAVDADEIRPTPRKEHLVEFVGDSITCGYGVDDEVAEHHFTTRTEDATRAYAYKTATLLDVDYSLVSISGYGIISGYTDTAEVPVTSQLLPDYYEKLGYSEGAYGGVTPADVAWDFTTRQPDVIVINLGTNDDSYCLDHADRQAQYCAAYTRFLYTVHAHNPGAMLLCTLGMMGDRLYPYVEKAVAAYRAETGDQQIACMPFMPQLVEDGYAADSHPTEATHRKAAQKLSAEIRRLMRW
ncbi:MAG: GDSL-type esterase/lipase family protein [Clostridiales bacterium]|nr:GDSL-type esterase/lipase family protein [Clostridiales bacterium]